MFAEKYAPIKDEPDRGAMQTQMPQSHGHDVHHVNNSEQTSKSTDSSEPAMNHLDNLVMAQSQTKEELPTQQQSRFSDKRKHPESFNDKQEYEQQQDDHKANRDGEASTPKRAKVQRAQLTPSPRCIDGKMSETRSFDGIGNQEQMALDEPSHSGRKE